VISISYPTDTMTFEQRMMSMRGNNIPFSRSTVFHELIRGHYLQQFMSERYRSYRRVFETPFWHEGNAFLLGDAFVGYGIPADTRGARGDAFLADAPLRADYFFFELSFGFVDAAAVRGFSGGRGGA
jgi:hypothetical protein